MNTFNDVRPWNAQNRPAYPVYFAVLITRYEFNRAVIEARPEAPYPVPSQEKYDDFMSYATSVGRSWSKRELAMFLANILWESDGLRAKEEYHPGVYSHPPLDKPGRRYYGRGYIQLTWSYNYAAASKALFDDERLLWNPEWVAKEEKLAWATAFWFWSAKVHTDPDVRMGGMFGASVRAINGGAECGAASATNDAARKRFNMYWNIFRVFGLYGRPNADGCY